MEGFLDKERGVFNLQKAEIEKLPLELIIVHKIRSTKLDVAAQGVDLLLSIVKEDAASEATALKTELPILKSGMTGQERNQKQEGLSSWWTSSIKSFGNRSFVFEEPTQNAQPTNPVEITEQWQMESSDIAPPFDFDPTFDD